MKKLESLLVEREVTQVKFDHLKNRIRCYAHIIHICCSHVVASATSVSKQFMDDLNIPIEPDRVFRDDSDNESEDGIDPYDGDTNADENIPPLKLDCSLYHDRNPSLKKWFEGVKHDPLTRARRVIRFIRSSGQRRTGFGEFIVRGNQNNWFSRKDSNGNKKTTQVRELELLRDVKTRWDSIYMMLDRLHDLRPVSLTWPPGSVETNLSECLTGYRSVF